MSKCIHCNSREGSYPFRVLDIQTLHVRDITGEKYVQAMGKTADYSICDACAGQYLAESSAFGSKYIKKLLPAFPLIVFGIIYTIFADFDIMYMRMLGPIAVLCGLVLIYTVFRDYRREKHSFDALASGEAVKKAAWLQLTASLPKKNGDQDVTYIPADSRTRGMSIAQLSSEYDLLPAVARQVKAELAKQ